MNTKVKTKRFNKKAYQKEVREYQRNGNDCFLLGRALIKEVHALVNQQQFTGLERFGKEWQILEQEIKILEKKRDLILNYDY